MLRWLLTVALAIAIAPAAQAQKAPVPFVGCAVDGQQGPLEAPGGGDTPSLPAAQAGRLAWYEGNDLGVLAPRDWHCVELYGAAGAVLLVTPERHDPGLLYGAPGLSGPFVIADVSYGDTSGRFVVASIAGPLFPLAKTFVQNVLLEPDTRTRLVSVANDRLTRRDDTVVSFVTPAHRDGIGTNGWVQKSALPVSGAAILLPDPPNFDLTMVRVRLPAELADLVPVIVEQKIRAVAGCHCAHQP